MKIQDVLWSLIMRVFKRTPLDSVVKGEENIRYWESIFRGNPDWLEEGYVDLSGVARTRTRRSMKAAKMITQKLSTLVYSELPEIVMDAGIEKVFEDNNFMETLVKKSERQFALGGQAIKLYVVDGEIKVDFVPAQRFIPVSWDNKGIHEADFIEPKTVDKKDLIRVESHRWENGEYVITNKVYLQQGETLTERQLHEFEEGLQEEVRISGLTYPLFAYIQNPGENNLDPDSPLGVSMYANADDTLESLDVAFDSLQNEIELGRRRIIVPSSAVRKEYVTEGGELKKMMYFDPSDRVYQAFDMGDAENAKIHDNSVPMRIQELRDAIQTNLDILSVQVGFDPGSLSFDGSAGLKTATEVISDKSETFKTKKAYENYIGKALIDLMNSIRELSKMPGIELQGITDIEYTINWNDSIIEDSNARLDRIIKEKDAGLLSTAQALEEYKGVSAQEALKLAEGIKQERATIDLGGILPVGEM
jgi:A118 family predicted phage portal protein